MLKRCGLIGDGWMPLGTPGDTSKGALELIAETRRGAGLSMDGFGIQAQAQYGGGTPERWRSHATKWRDVGATHLAIATHNAGPTDVDGHLARVAEYRDAVAEVASR